MSTESPDTDLFSMVLATEAEKIMPIPNADFPASIENIPFMGMTVPAEEAAAETAEGTAPAKNQDCADGANYLLLLPFLAFSPNDALWQNLPKRGNAAAPKGPATITPDAANTDSNSIDGLLAGSTVATNPLKLAESCPVVERKETPVPIETNGLAATLRTEPGPPARKAVQVKTDAVPAKQDREIDSKIKIEPNKNDPTSEQVLEAVPSRSSDHSTRETPQPVQAAVVQLSESETQLIGVSSTGPKMFFDSLPRANDVRINPLLRARQVLQKEERLETSGVAVEKLSESRGSPEPADAIPAAAGISHQENRNGDTARPIRIEPQLQITVRPANKESGARWVQVVSQSRPESKTREFALDPRSGGLVHDVVRHTGESFNAPDPVVSTQSEHWSQVEKANVISQLIEKARALRWDRNTEIVVSLKPESLGRISMRAFLVDRTMVAMIATESDKVRQLIQVEIPAIQHSLHESGIPARVLVSHQTDVNFDYSSAGNGQSPFRQDAPEVSPGEDVDSPPLAPEITDSRYGSHSVHLIA
jgi:flagellar hook-length control protein FliK